MLVSAAALPVIGKLGDLFGHRRVYIYGVLGSTIFAGLCIVAWDIWSLIAFRILAMVLAGCTGPAAMAILFHVYPPEHRTQAISWWSMGGPGAAALGLILGGPFVELFGWRSVFVLQAATGFGAVFLAWKVLPETEKQPARFDHVGNIILLIALSCRNLLEVLTSARAVPPALFPPIASMIPGGVLIALGYRMRKRG